MLPGRRAARACSGCRRSTPPRATSRTCAEAWDHRVRTAIRRGRLAAQRRRADRARLVRRGGARADRRGRPARPGSRTSRCWRSRRPRSTPGSRPPATAGGSTLQRRRRDPRRRRRRRHHRLLAHRGGARRAASWRSTRRRGRRPHPARRRQHGPRPGARAGQKLAGEGKQRRRWQLSGARPTARARPRRRCSRDAGQAAPGGHPRPRLVADGRRAADRADARRARAHCSSTASSRAVAARRGPVAARAPASPRSACPTPPTRRSPGTWPPSSGGTARRSRAGAGAEWRSSGRKLPAPDRGPLQRRRDEGRAAGEARRGGARRVARGRGRPAAARAPRPPTWTSRSPAAPPPTAGCARGRGIRIRGGTARAYYVGVEAAVPAVPGLAPPVRALCVAPFGMEEGRDGRISPARSSAWCVGEPAQFRFFASSVRREDAPATVVEGDDGRWRSCRRSRPPLPAGEREAGEVVPVRLRAARHRGRDAGAECVAREGRTPLRGWSGTCAATGEPTTARRGVSDVGERATVRSGSTSARSTPPWPMVDLRAPGRSRPAPSRSRPVAAARRTGHRSASTGGSCPRRLYLPGPELPAQLRCLPWTAERHRALGEPGRGRRAGRARRAARVPGRLVASAKSWLCHPRVDRRAPILPWGAPAGVPRLSPVAASRATSRTCALAWDQAHPGAPLAEQEVVLTVPASFDEVARELTLESARGGGARARHAARGAAGGLLRLACANRADPSGALELEGAPARSCWCWSWTWAAAPPTSR